MKWRLFGRHLLLSAPCRLRLTSLPFCPHAAGMTMRLSLSLCLFLSLLMPGHAGDTVGKPISPWKPGTLDIHQISTGRGNAGLYILPDGTTLLVDAGEMATKTAAHTPDRPDNTRLAGERLVRYI